LNDWKGFVEKPLCHVATRGKISVRVLFGDLTSALCDAVLPAGSHAKPTVSGRSLGGPSPR
jgi:hypothetical protein